MTLLQWFYIIISANAVILSHLDIILEYTHYVLSLDWSTTKQWWWLYEWWGMCRFFFCKFNKYCDNYCNPWTILLLTLVSHALLLMYLVVAGVWLWVLCPPVLLFPNTPFCYLLPNSPLPPHLHANSDASHHLASYAPSLPLPYHQASYAPSLRHPYHLEAFPIPTWIRHSYLPHHHFLPRCHPPVTVDLTIEEENGRQSTEGKPCRLRKVNIHSKSCIHLLGC